MALTISGHWETFFLEAAGLLSKARQLLTLMIYTKYSMMRIIIDVRHNAKKDILNLLNVDKPAAMAIIALLEQLKADPRVLDKLTTPGSNDIGSVQLNVKRWQSMRSKANLWRFRILKTPATSYRVIYGYHWQTQQLCVFAVVHKEEFDYDDLNSPVARRIADDWKSL